MTDTLFRCDAVSRTYGAGPLAVVALHEVTCSAPVGARIAISGPSGSGKSTLLHLLAGLDTPSQGRIEWPALNGHPGQDPALVGVIFQNRSLIPALSAQENVALPLVFQDVPHREAQQRALASMDKLGIEGLARRLPDELSGGQAQRVAIARVLTSRPALILADEPTGRLDHRAAAQVIDVLLATAHELGSGLVIATHDPRVSERLAVRWRMRDGALQQLAPAESGTTR